MSFDLASAAAATGVAKSSVLRAIKAGRISATRDDNGRWHVEPVELFKIFPPLPHSMEAEVSMQAVAASESADEAALDGGDVASLVQKIAAESIAELKRLIGELQQAHDNLQTEGERIEREATRQVALSQTALESVKLISETVGGWRKAGHPVRDTNGR
jgi:hypothetical protein